MGLWGGGLSSSETTYQATAGSVVFTSNAPLEIIRAESDQLRGILVPEEKRFAFTVAMRSFAGFNSPLQREHFRENYLETDRFPSATFSGKIIDAVDFSTPGTYTVRTKGILEIHGVPRERIIRGKLTVEKDYLRITADFTVPLEAHNIRIPRLVRQKIAETIAVSITTEMRSE